MKRHTYLAAALALAIAAQTKIAPAAQDQARSDPAKTAVPKDEGQSQPQGKTGPIDTRSSGGAPAESPQGETPPGMQSAPAGSSKTTTGPK